MKIFIDIGHPAHVHYFKNFIKIMEAKGHKFFILAKNKEVTFSLLKIYNIPYKSRGKSPKGKLGKLFNILFLDIKVLFWALKFKPDVFLSFAGGPNRISKLMGIPSLAFDDTEHAKISHFLYLKQATHILTPSCYSKSFSDKQIYFKGYMELCYLHSNYFKPDKTIINKLGINTGEKYVILRFISWNASHDFGHKGFSYNQKLKLVNELSKYAKVFISSESDLPLELKRYQLKTSPNKLHDILAFASLYIGEGGTTANECACMGVPNILVNSLLNPKTIPGIHKELEKYGLQILFENPDDVIVEIACSILKDEKSKDEFNKKRNLLLNDKIDVTAFMVWLIENYPESVKKIKANPEFQLSFK